MKYGIMDKGDGEIVIGLGSFGIAKVYYEEEYCQSPLSQGEAMTLCEKIVSFVEEKHPSSEMNEDDWDGKIPIVEFLEYCAKRMSEE